MVDIESKIALLAREIKGSITMEVTALANQLKSEGKKVISMSAGEPDYDTPEFIKDAAKQALDNGYTKYTAASGLPELKKIISERIKNERGLDYLPSQIVVSCGAKHSLYNAMAALINPGDEVIVPSPYWVSYPDQIKMLGGIPVVVKTEDTHHFKMTAQQLASAITPKTKLCILNSPSNPTGVIYTPEELSALADVIVKHDLLVISDEIYAKLVYEGQHVSIASFGKEIKERTIFVDGLSKAYSMTGWRVGYLAAPQSIATTISHLQSHSTSNPTTISQYASIAALQGDDSDVATMVASFDSRRKIMVDGLNNIEGISCITPQGAFYAFPNISKLIGQKTQAGEVITSDVEFCKLLLKERLVACVPGSGFGADGYIRLSYATSEEAIQEAMNRIGQFVGSLVSETVSL
jgi:aspartate aminotransferase